MAFQSQPLEPKSPWLAITFGCCASQRDSVDDDEGRAALQAQGGSEMQICYDQPQTVPQLRAEQVQPRPGTSMSMKSQVSAWVTSSRDFAARASSRASLHTPSRPRRSHSRPRPSIGRPMDFRHYDGLNGTNGSQSMFDDLPMPVRRRRSFRPLELSIYFADGRLSPLPDFSEVEWVNKPPDLELPAQALVRDRDSRTNSISSNISTSSYLLQRKPVGTGSRRSSVQSQRSVQSRPVSGTLSTLPYLLEEPKSRPESLVSDRPAIQRANTAHGTLSPTRIISRLPSPNRARANTAPTRPGSLRKAKNDVDEEIRELNTIVEERRADAYRSTSMSPALINRPPPSPSHHVPLLAPSLRMHVRSETLSDIGSAFSVPLIHKTLPTSPLPPAQPQPQSLPPKSISRSTMGLSLAPPKRSFTGPLNSNPITPPTPTVPTPTTPIHRLGAWLKRSLPSTPSSPAFFKSLPSTPKSQSVQSHSQSPTSHSHSAPQTPFYQCESLNPRPSTSRPSTADSRTLHTRQASNDTATVTLLSSYPSTPTLSTRSLSPETTSAPATPARVNLLRGEGKTRRVPAPLVLAKEKEYAIEASLGSARSGASFASARSRASSRSLGLRPPPSPHYGLLPGMEVSARSVEVGYRKRDRISGEGTPVGVAF